MARPKAPRNAAARASAAARQLHTLGEDYPWSINYSGHAPRADSLLYRKSRTLMNRIATAASRSNGAAWPFGASPWEDHHGGGLWLHDGKGWFFLKNFAGIEWASQFCADPQKVECLRANAARVYVGALYDNTKREILKLSPGYPFDAVLKTPIRDAAGMARWTDSIFNASVPLPKLRHTGVSPKGHGLHHYPTPIWDIELFKRKDFVLWVLDAERRPAAVVPVHPRGVSKADPLYAADYGKVAVAWATPGTKLEKLLKRAEAKRKVVYAGPQHALARQAFRKQAG